MRVFTIMQKLQDLAFCVGHEKSRNLLAEITTDTYLRGRKNIRMIYCSGSQYVCDKASWEFETDLESITDSCQT